MYSFVLLWAFVFTQGSVSATQPSDLLAADLPTVAAVTSEFPELHALPPSMPLAVLPPDDPGAGSSSAPNASDARRDPGISVGGKRTENPPAPDDFQWQPALQQSAMFTGIMHGWRFSTERGTRDALRGPFFHDWMRSVGELRGWDDGDSFMTSYIAHPMEGAIFGFIQQQNDPRYRGVEFGDGRPYWISRLHSLAFATMMSTQWTLGPASESSLGNTNLYASPGFVDLAGTPTLGMGWMIGEDIIDKYGIEWLETRTANPYLLAVARGLFNPTRSFANLMSLRVPWHRESRPGLFGHYEAARQVMVADGSSDPYLGFASGFTRPAAPKAEDPDIHPLEAPIELMPFYNYERLGSQNCYGGGAAGAARVNPQWQIVAELNGCLITGFDKYQSGDSLSYLVGPRYAPRAAKRISPFGQLLMGGRRITHELLNPTARALLLNLWNEGALAHYPMRSEYSVENQANGFALAMGGGCDIRLSRAFALRIADLEYTHSWLPPVDQIHAADGIRFTAGLVLRIGTW